MIPMAPLVFSLSLSFASPPEIATAAFGPVAESVWAPDFMPRFVYPDPPAQVAGAVFTTPDGRTWLLHDFDPAAGYVQYVVIKPGSELLTLTIRVRPNGSGSAATMTYDIVTLDGAGSEHAAALRERAPHMAEHMQAAIAGYLAEQAR